MQAVVAHADAETRRHPVQNNCSGKNSPAKDEERGNCAKMEQPYDNADRPVDLLAFGSFDDDSPR